MAEGGRQAFDASQGRDYDIGAAIGAGIAPPVDPEVGDGRKRLLQRERFLGHREGVPDERCRVHVIFSPLPT